MPDKFVVPQFIDNEDKILGPITVRQFMICLVAVFVIFIEYSILRLPYFIGVAFITIALAGTFAFLKINGQPFHLFFLNALQTIIRPPLRVWDKRFTDRELRHFLASDAPVSAPVTTSAKSKPASTRLRQLALTVNTGGVYNAEEDSL